MVDYPSIRDVAVKQSFPVTATLFSATKPGDILATINYLSTVDFEFGAVARLEDFLSSTGIARPMLVTDQGIVAAGLVDRIRAHLPKRDPLAVFDKTPSNPTE